MTQERYGRPQRPRAQHYVQTAECGLLALTLAMVVGRAGGTKTISQQAMLGSSARGVRRSVHRGLAEQKHRPVRDGALRHARHVPTGTVVASLDRVCAAACSRDHDRLAGLWVRGVRQALGRLRHGRPVQVQPEVRKA
jgi:hypothetical protein